MLLPFVWHQLFSNVLVFLKVANSHVSLVLTGDHQTDLVVVDDNIVTSRGAGTALAFAYALVDLLGGDGQQLAHTMVYDRLFQ